MDTATATRENIVKDLKNFVHAHGKFTSDYWRIKGKYDRATVENELGTANVAGVNAILFEMEQAGNINDTETIQNIVQRYRKATPVKPRPTMKNPTPYARYVQDRRNGHVRKVNAHRAQKIAMDQQKKMEHLSRELIAYYNAHGELTGYYETSNAVSQSKMYTMLGTSSLGKLERFIEQANELDVPLADVAHFARQERMRKQAFFMSL